MIDSYWNNQSDPYQYTNSQVLRNIPDIQDIKLLEIFEQRATSLRLDEVLIAIAEPKIDMNLWQTIHRILFQDIYDWAGEIRTVQLAKGTTVFAMPEHITSQATRIFNELNNENFKSLDQSLFVTRLAYYFGELNVLHPFREGNGRTQKLLFDEIVRRMGYNINWEKIDVNSLLQAVIKAFHEQDYSLISKLFNKAIDKLNF